MKLVIATTSAHKANEIRRLLADQPDLEIQTLSDYPATEVPEEDGETMADNARIKAEFYARRFNALVLADDSGLEVDALNGEPGVHSARWSEGSDEDRVQALLERLDGTEPDARTARYRCTLCLADTGGPKLETEGTCEGAIAFGPRGTNGFGYDPVFEITLGTGADTEWVGKTLGQAPPEVKASVSHRARATKALAEKLGNLEL